MKLFPKSNKDLKENLKRLESFKKMQKKAIEEMENNIEDKKKAIREALSDNQVAEGSSPSGPTLILKELH